MDPFLLLRFATCTVVLHEIYINAMCLFCKNPYSSTKTRSLSTVEQCGERIRRSNLQLLSCHPARELIGIQNTRNSYKAQQIVPRTQERNQNFDAPIPVLIPVLIDASILSVVFFNLTYDAYNTSMHMRVYMILTHNVRCHHYNLRFMFLRISVFLYPSFLYRV